MMNDAIITNLNKSIVLVGLMGAGKTSVGREVAKRLGLNFVDSDDLIVEAAGKEISDIFKDEGEEHFRALEQQVLRDAIHSDQVCIISTGGGAFMNDATRKAIQESAISLFLEADIDVLVARVGTSQGRPLFKDKDPKEVLSDLIEVRYPIYKQAHVHVDTYDEQIEETLNRVIETLYTYTNAG